MYSGGHFTVLRYILVDSDLAKHACRLETRRIVACEIVANLLKIIYF